MLLREFKRRLGGRPALGRAPKLAALALHAAALSAFVFVQTPAAQSQPITFHNNTMADFSATSGEPIIKVDGRDRIFVTTPFGLSTTVSMLWRSDDGGRSFLPLGPPVLRDAVTGPGAAGDARARRDHFPQQHADGLLRDERRADY